MNEIKVNMQNLANEQQKQLLELIEIANNPRTLKLTLGDRYYFINTFNQIEQYIYHNTELDDILLKSRNVFLTQEEAKSEVLKRLTQDFLTTKLHYIT